MFSLDLNKVCDTDFWFLVTSKQNEIKHLNSSPWAAESDPTTIKISAPF